MTVSTNATPLGADGGTMETETMSEIWTAEDEKPVQMMRDYAARLNVPVQDVAIKLISELWDKVEALENRIKAPEAKAAAAAYEFDAYDRHVRVTKEQGQWFVDPAGGHDAYETLEEALLTALTWCKEHPGISSVCPDHGTQLARGESCECGYRDELPRWAKSPKSPTAFARAKVADGVRSGTSGRKCSTPRHFGISSRTK